MRSVKLVAIPAGLIVVAMAVGTVVAQDDADAPAATPPREAPPKQLAERTKKSLSRDREREAVIEAGLDWLARHQSEGGHWSPHDFSTEDCQGACTGPGGSTYMVGVTALAALAFLGTGDTHETGEHAEPIRGAIEFLLQVQDSEGCFGPRTDDRFLYGHAAATMALAEAWWLSRDPALREPVERARDFAVLAQNPELGWRYNVRKGDNDTSVTVWMVEALATCELAGAEVPDASRQGPIAWIEKMTEEGPGKIGYQRRGGADSRMGTPLVLRTGGRSVEVEVGGEKVSVPMKDVHLATTSDEEPRSGRVVIETGDPLLREQQKRFGVGRAHGSNLTAAGTLALILCRRPIKELRTRCELVFSVPFQDYQADGTTDLHLALHGSLLAAQALGNSATKKPAAAWLDGVQAHLLAAQIPASDDAPTHAAGSWPPERSPFGAMGGRVYSTSMAILALQARTRWPRWDRLRHR